MKIKVRALVTGTHALSGLYIEKGREYEVEEAHAGPEVFEKTTGQADVGPSSSGGPEGGSAVPPSQRKGGK